MRLWTQRIFRSPPYWRKSAVTTTDTYELFRAMYALRHTLKKYFRQWCKNTQRAMRCRFHLASKVIIEPKYLRQPGKWPPWTYRR
jgi:hypothetical protein